MNNEECKNETEGERESVLTDTACSTLTLNFKGDPRRPHEICKSDFEKLRDGGMLWELFPDAPDVFPSS